MTTLDEKRARRLLRHTWHAFFGRFGRLTEAQRAAMEPILDGRSVVLCAPTASGKTEALLGPMVERCAARRPKVGLQILVICPTRALCNDFYRRIEAPMRACGQPVGIKTGDSPSLSYDEPPRVVVTTPESLDSMLSRRPAVLQHLEGLFLDELHLLDASPRGDHLRALVWRVASFRPDLQVCAASATAADAHRLAEQFAGPDAEVISVSGTRDREIEASFAWCPKMAGAAGVIRGALNDEPGSKLLVYCNTRNEVEYLSTALADERAFAHHGSLAKDERLRTERGFLNASSGVCVATMTLELGIDIGDVDRVVLINPPPNVASFVQRVGRSNRRGGSSRAICIYSTWFDLRRFEHQIACARRGELFPERVYFRPTVFAQQAVSLAYQNPKGWVSADAMHERLPPTVAWRWSGADLDKILEEMRADDYLHADSHGRYVPDEPAKEAFEYGLIHTHIEEDGEIEVVDEATGRTIGTAAFSPEERARSPKKDPGKRGILLAGRERDITRVRDGRVFVESRDLDSEPQFLSRRGPRYSYELARDLAEFIGLAEDEIRLVQVSNRSWEVWHFFGTIWGLVLEQCLERLGFDTRRTGPFKTKAFRSQGKPPESLGSRTRLEDEVDGYIRAAHDNLQRKLQPGPWRRHVPDELLHAWVNECARPVAFAEAAARYRLVVGDPLAS
ncbi:MAG: DEAD/DEAH box helicase [Persicimonas sp.]